MSAGTTKKPTVVFVRVIPLVDLRMDQAWPAQTQSERPQPGAKTARVLLMLAFFFQKFG
jgi:hypothetical protein